MRGRRIGLMLCLLLVAGFSSKEAEQKLAGRWQGVGLWNGKNHRDGLYRVTFEPRARYAILDQPGVVISGNYTIDPLDDRTFRIVVRGHKLTVQFNEEPEAPLTVAFEGDAEVTPMKWVGPASGR